VIFFGLLLIDIGIAIVLSIGQLCRGWWPHDWYEALGMFVGKLGISTGCIFAASLAITGLVWILGGIVS